MAYSDIRPGDIWIENDGDYVFIIDEDPNFSDSWEVHAFYNVTARGTDGQWDGFTGTSRHTRDLAKLLFRPEPSDIGEAGTESATAGLLSLTADEVAALRKLLTRLV